MTTDKERVIEIASKLDQTAGKGCGKNFILSAEELLALIDSFQSADARNATRYFWLRGILNKTGGAIFDNTSLFGAEFWYRTVARNGTMTALTRPVDAELDNYIDTLTL